jgi:hypothetical protein
VDVQGRDGTPFGESDDQRGRVPLRSLEDYLVRGGWAVQERDARTVHWARAGAEGARVVTPAALTSDYPDQLEDALRVLSSVEQRPATDIQEDAAEAGVDALWLRLTPDAPSGQVPLTVAHEVIGALRELVVGSASALTSKALVLPPQRPRRAQAYVERVRVSTAPGSFVVRLAMPLSDEWEVPSAPSEDDVLVDVPESPYGRQVVTRLRIATAHALQLATKVGSGEERLAAFGRAGSAAANATELASLASLGSLLEGRSLYRMHFSLSPLAPRSRRDLPLDWSVTPAQQTVLAEAADFLRTRQPRMDVLVAGLIIRLAREGKQGSGNVWLQAVLDDSGRERRIQLELTEADYIKAIHAHEQGLFVHATGDVKRKGNWSVLSPVRSFDVRPSLLDEMGEGLY